LDLMQNMMQKGLSSLLDSSDSNTSNNGALKSASRVSTRWIVIIR